MPPTASVQPLLNATASVHGGVGGALPSGSVPVSDPDPSRQSDGEAPRAILWRGPDWFKAFAKAWCAKYGVLAMAGSEAGDIATGDLTDRLERLSRDERLAAQARAGVMFGEFLGEDEPKIIRARHPWSWFATRFDGLRVPALITASRVSTAPESFLERDARVAREAAARTSTELDAAVRATDEKLAASKIDPKNLPTREQLAALRRPDGGQV